MTGSLAQILHSDDVAALLGINVQEVRQAARDGTLPAYRLPGGRRLFFFREEIEALVDRSLGPPGAGEEG